MDKQALAFDPSLINHWVVLWQVPNAPPEVLPAGGPVVAWLYWWPWDQALMLAIESAVFVARDGRVTRVGPLLRRRDGAPHTFVLSASAQPHLLPDPERIRLGLPERPDAHPAGPHDHDAAPAALHAHALRCLEVGDLDGAERHLVAAIEWSDGDAYYHNALAAFVATHRASPLVSDLSPTE